MKKISDEVNIHINCDLPLSTNLPSSATFFVNYQWIIKRLILKCGFDWSQSKVIEALTDLDIEQSMEQAFDIVADYNYEILREENEE